MPGSSLTLKSPDAVYTRTGLGSNFTPAALGSQLRLWARMDAGATISSGTLTALADQSAAGNNLAPTSGQAPVIAVADINGVSTFYQYTPFAVLQNMFTAANPFAAAITKTTPFFVSMIVRYENSTEGGPYDSLCSQGFIWEVGHPFWAVLCSSQTLKFALTNGLDSSTNLTGIVVTASVGGSSAPLIPGQAYAITITYDGSGAAAGVKIYLNGSLCTLTTVLDALGTISITDQFIVGVPGWSQQAGESRYAEIVLGSGTLTTAQLASLNTYMGLRSGLF